MKPTGERSQRLLPAVQPAPSGIFKHFSEISPESVCDTCGLRLASSEVSIKIPSIRGVFCSNLCCEQSLIHDSQRCWACAVELEEGRSAHYCDDACRKSIADEPWGSGKRLLRWLALERPELYRRLFEGAAVEQPIGRCLECGVSLNGKRARSKFCDETHKKRFQRRERPQATQKCGIIRDTPIGKQGLTISQNGGSTNTLTALPQGLETAPRMEVLFANTNENLRKEFL